MNGTWDGDRVHVPGGRQSLHQSRGYGAPDGSDVWLAPVEAVHLLRRGDLDTVDGAGQRQLLSRVDGPELRAFSDLRTRGFRLQPASRAQEFATDPGPADFVVYERGADPGGPVALRLGVVGQTEPVPADRIAALASAGGGALAVADDEGEVSYFALDRPALAGETRVAFPDAVTATRCDDRVVAWDVPARLYDPGFYGTPLDDPTDGSGNEAADGPIDLHLSLVEAAHLAGCTNLTLDGADGPDGTGGLSERADASAPARDRLIERGRALAGEAFDRQLHVYEALRDAGIAPRSGYKFGADFRTYEAVDSAADSGHSADLVWVRPPDRPVHPRSLALRVRLAGGVRKRTVFARTDATDGVTWIAAERLTP